MNCCVKGCNGVANRRYHGPYCDDCYEELFLALPAGPSIWQRIKTWWAG